jgi:hypothetical protein
MHHQTVVVQFVLDMEFLTQVSLYGKFLSRTTRQLIGDVIARANTAFSATGTDPQRFASIHLGRSFSIVDPLMFFIWVSKS